MIRNERQYKTTLTAIAGFEQALKDRLTVNPPDSGIHPKIWELERLAVEGDLEKMRADVTHYEELKSGLRRAIAIHSWADVPRALIEGRIAANMTQKQLAKKLGIPEQQLQRYEATDYSAASLTRIQEIAACLSLELSGLVTPVGTATSPERFLARLADLGVDRTLLFERLLPIDIADALSNAARRSKATGTAALVQAAELISHVFDVATGALFSEAPLTPSYMPVGATRYKGAKQPRSKKGEVKSVAYTTYAYFIAQQIVKASQHLPSRNLPRTAAAIRESILEKDEELTFRTAIVFFWDHGIPVVPLSDSGVFHGACWRLRGGREVVVLKQRSESADRWLSDLLHEGGHIVQEPGDRPFAILEDAIPSVTDERERAATEFAANVILGGLGESLAVEALERVDGNVPFLKRIVPEVAAQGGVRVGAFANYMAYYLARETEGRVNWWGTAQALQPVSENPWRVARDLLLENVDLEVLSEPERDLIIRALRAAPRPHVTLQEP